MATALQDKRKKVEDSGKESRALAKIMSERQGSFPKRLQVMALENFAQLLEKASERISPELMMKDEPSESVQTQLLIAKDDIERALRAFKGNKAGASRDAVQTSIDRVQTVLDFSDLKEQHRPLATKLNQNVEVIKRDFGLNQVGIK